MSAPTEIDYSGEDNNLAAGTTTAPPVEPLTEPEAPECPTHTHPDGTVHPGTECAGGCIH